MNCWSLIGLREAPRSNMESSVSKVLERSLPRRQSMYGSYISLTGGGEGSNAMEERLSRWRLADSYSPQFVSGDCEWELLGSRSRPLPLLACLGEWRD